MIRRPRTAQLAILIAVGLFATGCEEDNATSTGPTPVAGGGTASTGSQRLVWGQIGDVSKMRFRAYVNNRAFDLSATCNNARPEAECSAPLPPLGDGLHTIELVAVLGVESNRSAPVTVQKPSGRATAAALSFASTRSGRLNLEPVVTLADGLSFTADIVATGVRAPAQLSWLSDGRLLVAEADGRVRVVRPGEPENRDPALEAGMLSDTAAGAMGIASHPDFAQNRLVYVSLLERERGQTRLRVVRLREVGDTLGEAATLFEAPIEENGATADAGPRMAFGPDRLLYVMLPPGMEFDNEPAASTPRASMLRLSDEGRATGEPLSGIVASPLAFTWTTTGALWAMFREGDGVAALRSLETRGGVRVMGADSARLRMREGVADAAGTLFVQASRDNLLAAQALLGSRGEATSRAARLALPVQTMSGLADRIGDVLAGDNGTLFVTTQNAAQPGAPGTPTDAVVRLTPVRR